MPTTPSPSPPPRTSQADGTPEVHQAGVGNAPPARHPTEEIQSGAPERKLTRKPRR